MTYADRSDAGRRLAAELERFRDASPLVYGLPRGGVTVAAVVAEALGAPLRALPARKLGLPWYPELAMGAVAPGARVLLDKTIEEFGVSEADVAAAEKREEQAVARRGELFARGRPDPDPAGRVCLVVDDGLATGATMAAAVRSLRASGAGRVVACAPVGSREAVDWLSREADEIVCPETPEPFSSVGQWYESFDQVDDTDVLAFLDEAAARPSVTPRSSRICGRQTPPAGAWGTI